MIPKLTSPHHPLIKRLAKLRSSSRAREEEGTVLIEGRKMVAELGSLFPLKVLLVTDEALIPEGIAPCERFLVTEALLGKVAGSRSPEGIAAEVAMPPYRSVADVKKLVVFDRVSDPGNLGTLLRAALALGWEGAYLLEGCCDPYNDKALRAAKGATFRLPMERGGWDSLRPLLKGFTPYAAEMEGIPLSKVKKTSAPIALLLGNESHGLAAEADPLCTKVAVPMSGAVESLNVATAGAILLYALGGVDER